MPLSSNPNTHVTFFGPGRIQPSPARIFGELHFAAATAGFFENLFEICLGAVYTSLKKRTLGRSWTPDCLWPPLLSDFRTTASLRIPFGGLYKRLTQRTSGRSWTPDCVWRPLWPDFRAIAGQCICWGVIHKFNDTDVRSAARRSAAPPPREPKHVLLVPGWAPAPCKGGELGPSGEREVSTAELAGPCFGDTKKGSPLRIQRCHPADVKKVLLVPGWAPALCKGGSRPPWGRRKVDSRVGWGLGNVWRCHPPRGPTSVLLVPG